LRALAHFTTRTGYVTSFLRKKTHMQRIAGGRILAAERGGRIVIRHVPPGGELVLDLLSLRAGRLQERALVCVEDRGDRVQAEAQPPQRENPVQPLYVRCGVPPMPTARAFARREQPDLVVVVQRSHGDSRRLRQFADRPFTLIFCHRRAP
jgi:nucleotide-binding universal stress UspA family protein